MKTLKINRLWLGLLLANLFVFSVLAFAIHQNRQRTLDEARLVAENYSHTLERGFSELIRRIDFSLLSTVDEYQHPAGSGRLDAQALQQFLERQHSRLPEVVGLRISDAQGNIRLAAGGVALVQANIAETEHFQRARAAFDADKSVLLFSEPFLGKQGSLRMVHMLRPYRGSNGSFGGVVLAAVALDQLSLTLRTIELGPYGVDSLWSPRQLIARNTKNDFLDANSAPPKPVPQLQALIDSGERKTVYHTAGTVDGISRLVSVRKIDAYPLYVAVGLADQDFFKRWREDSTQLALFAVVFALGSTLITALAVRSENRRLRLNAKLQDEESRFRSVFDHANDGIFILEDGVLIDCNPRAAELLGMPREELLGKVPSAISPRLQPDGRPSQTAAQAYLEAAAQGKPQHFEWRHLHANGSPLDVDVTLNDLNLKGRTYLQAIVRDVSARKRSERELLALNQRMDSERRLLKTLINTLPELVWLKDLNGVYLTCNPAFEKFFGHTESEIIGKTDFDFVDDALARSFRAFDLAAIQANRVTYNEEWVTYASDGHQALLLTGKTPMIGANGLVTGVLGIAHDITQQRRTEEALALHQRNLQQLVDERTEALGRLNQKLLDTQFAMECVGIGIHWVDVETGRFMAVNKIAAAMIGYDVEEMLQLRVMDIDPNFPQDAYDQFKEHLRRQGHITIETTQRARDGRMIPFEVSIYYHEGEGSRSAQFISFQTDISQRKAAEQALILAKQQAEDAHRQLQIADQHLSAMFALSQEASALDTEEILQRGLDAAVRLSGSSVGTLHRFVQGQDRPELQLRAGASAEADASLQRSMTVPVALNAALRLVVTVGNKPSDYDPSDRQNFQRLCNDLASIYQRRHTEIALAQAQKSAEAATVAKSAFLANMSHEIRTPLNAITGMTHLIRRSGVTPEQGERLKKIEMAGDHLLEIINAVLDLSKIEAGKFGLEEVPLDIGSVVANVMSILSPQIQAKKLSLVMDNPLSGLRFLGDPTRLQQGLLNFGSNAIKFSVQGQITIRVQLLGSDEKTSLIRFAVEDQGIGIEQATLDRLFSAFEQADSSTTRQYGGTGLGLAITRKLAQLMGGDAGARSEVGRGSEFWFTARLRNKASVAVAPSPTPSLPAEAVLARDYPHCRLLLVEDDPFNQEIAQILLQEIWPVVDVAGDGLEAVQKVEAQRYDLILMDVQMPRLDGLDATRRIRTLDHGRDVPVIAMTANAFLEDRQRCIEAGMNDFLSKPVKPQELYEMILKWVRR